jgi:hypothetical protein
MTLLYKIGGFIIETNGKGLVDLLSNLEEAKLELI